MEEMTTFRVICNSIVFFALFAELALLVLVRDRCNWVCPRTAELRPIAWLIVIDTAGVTIAMVCANLSDIVPLTLLVSTVFMGRTMWCWEKNVDAKRGSF